MNTLLRVIYSGTKMKKQFIVKLLCIKVNLSGDTISDGRLAIE